MCKFYHAALDCAMGRDSNSLSTRRKEADVNLQESFPLGGAMSLATFKRPVHLENGSEVSLSCFSSGSQEWGGVQV